MESVTRGHFDALDMAGLVIRGIACTNRQFPGIIETVTHLPKASDTVHFAMIDPVTFTR